MQFNNLIQVIDSGYLSQIRTFIDENPSIDINTDRNYDEPISSIHRAIALNYVNVIALLLEKGVNVNSLDSGGYTPLYKAAMHGNVEIVNLLIKHNANINQKSNGWTALHIAAKRGFTETVRLLLKRGAYVNAEDSIGEIALHNAAACGHFKIVRILLASKTAINKRSLVGRTPIHTTCQTESTRILSLLVKYGANVNESDNNGITPIIEAVNHGNPKMVSLLIDLGADVNCKTKTGITPQWIAAAKRDHEILGILNEKREKREDDLELAIKKDDFIGKLKRKLDKIVEDRLESNKKIKKMEACINRLERECESLSKYLEEEKKQRELMESKVEQMEIKLTCRICLVNTRDTMVFPCSHFLYCHVCINSLKEKEVSCMQHEI